MKFRNIPVEVVPLRKSHRQVVAIVPIHQRDADLFLDQLLAEITRLDWDVAWHLNGVNPNTIKRVASWPRTIGYSLATGRVPFVDIDRNYALEMAMNSGAPWISPHDADETLEPNAPEMLKDLLLKTPSHIVVKWYNIWKVDGEGLHIRMDGQFMGYKARFYSTKGYRYCYRMNSASVYPDNCDWPPRVDSGLRILHWGFSDPESRQWHFNRWDGKINSDYWKGLVDPEIELQCKLQVFDPSIDHDEFYRRYQQCQS